MRTEFCDQVLRQEMKVILVDSNKTDSELLDEVNKIARRENESDVTRK